MQIAKNSVVAFDYTLTNPEGKVLDSSQGREPLEYLHGGGRIIVGLEKQLEGKKAGDSFKVTIPAVEAYGERDQEMIQEVPRDNFAGIEKIEAGMQFHARGAQGVRVVTVVEVKPETVKVDGNHPLAGIPLTFDVKIVTVRAATEEELSHSCGEGGCSSCKGCH